jgi:hypothetical protein
VYPHRVGADAQDLGIEAFELPDVLLERLQFARSDGGEIREVEGKHHVLLATVLGKSHFPLC